MRVYHIPQRVEAGPAPENNRGNNLPPQAIKNAISREAGAAIMQVYNSDKPLEMSQEK